VTTIAVGSLLAGLAAPASATWPGTNGFIAWARAEPNSGSVTLTMNSRGTAKRSFFAGAYQARWSPDGTRIAFTHDFMDNDDVWVADPDGSNAVNLTNDPAADSQPDWSPDGQLISFISDRNGTPSLYAMSAIDGSGVVLLIDGPMSDARVDPACTQFDCPFLYVSDVTGDQEIYFADRGFVFDITNNPATDDSPSWSPDGLHILFETNRDGDWEIYRMDPPFGDNPVDISNNPSQDRYPVSSPDGLRLAFASDRLDPGNMDIYTVGVNGLGPRRLTFSVAQDTTPDWEAR